MFTSDTSRMNREVQRRLATNDDAVPEEFFEGVTRRIDRSELTELLEEAGALATGTPKHGLPAYAPQVATASEEAAPVAPVQHEPTLPVTRGSMMRGSRLRDVLIGGSISLVAMVAWYCATQL